MVQHAVLLETVSVQKFRARREFAGYFHHFWIYNSSLTPHNRPLSVGFESNSLKRIQGINIDFQGRLTSLSRRCRLNDIEAQ